MAEKSANHSDKNIHKGHRQKVRERYYESGLDGMADHNVLEFLLFFGIVQKDTNPLAHELIDRFGSFSGVLEAKREDLLNVKGMTETAACLLSMLLPVFKHYTKDLTRTKRVLETTDDYVSFLRPQFYDTTNEKVYIICLDSSNKVITGCQIAEGDFSNVDMNIREIVSCALRTQAKQIVLCHNHPHGITAPSRADVEATKTLYHTLDALKVGLIDHIIITDEGHFSMASKTKYATIFYGYGEVE